MYSWVGDVVCQQVIVDHVEHHYQVKQQQQCQPTSIHIPVEIVCQGYQYQPHHMARVKAKLEWVYVGVSSRKLWSCMATTFSITFSRNRKSETRQ